MTYFFQMGEAYKYIDLLIKGMWLTLSLSALSIIIGLLTGWIVAIWKVSEKKILSIIASVYIEFWRNTPLLIQVFFVYYGFTALTGLSFTAYQAGLLAIILNTTAYNAEILRGGIQAIPKVQIEAAKALGLDSFHIWYTVIIPYVHRIVFPSLINQFVLIILGTSLLSVIAVPELMNEAKELQALTGRTIEIYLLIAGIYVGIIFIFSAIMRFIEGKFFTLRH